MYQLGCHLLEEEGGTNHLRGGARWLESSTYQLVTAHLSRGRYLPAGSKHLSTEGRNIEDRGSTYYLEGS